MYELISIIIPVYNVEKYLRECLDSVIGQTYKNLEIILVDDGSQDTSSIICDEYAKKDSRIKVIHKQNEGVSAARNYGLDIMTGEFFSFIDSDDVIHPRYIEILYKLISSNKTDISSCGVSFCNGNERYEFDTSVSEPKATVLNKYQYASGLVSDFTLLYSVVWCKLFRTKLHSSLRFPDKKTFEDTIYMINCLRIGVSCANTDVPLYIYLKRESSLSSEKDVAYLLELSEINKYQYETLKDCYDEPFRSSLFCKCLNVISRRATDVYWNIDKREAKKFYLFWLAFYNSDKKYVKGAKEKVKILLYRYFPHLYYLLMKSRIYSAVKVS